MTLTPSNPYGPPLIDSRLIESEFDLLTLREGAKALKKLMSSRAFADWKLTLAGPAAEAKTDAELDQYIRNTAGHGFHVVGTAAMSPPNADYGVVDPDLKVKKVTGLRVVDASIFVSFASFLILALLTSCIVAIAIHSCGAYTGVCLCCCGTSCRFGEGGMETWLRY